MENRGQKRIEAVEELPVDKRACSSSEFRPSASTSSSQTPICSTPEVDVETDTMSWTSRSTRSEKNGEKESAHDPYVSSYSVRGYYRPQSRDDQSQYDKILSNLCEEVDDCMQLACLTELCELLSFATDGSLSSLMVDSLSPILVKLTRHESNPDIVLLALRAITYLSDGNPWSSSFLVRHDVVPALCQRLMAIEYLDVAEQCLQALEKISREQPLACLQSGAIMSVLRYVDFFSTSVQRVALSTVVNTCRKLSSERPLLFMEAVPIMCSLLQYEDGQLVESVVICLIKIVEQVSHSSDVLDELCNYGLVQQVVRLIDLKSQITLSQPTYLGLIRSLVKLVSGSTVALKSLFDFNISGILKDMLSTYDLSHGMQSTSMVDGHHSQMHTVLKLLNELLPTVARKQDAQLTSDKEDFLMDRADILQKFQADLLPILIQVVKSGVDMYVCYRCLSVIDKLVCFRKSDMLLNVLQTANFSSFLAGVLTGKDHHMILLALQIVDAVLLKLPRDFLHSFIKEGGLFAIDALLSPDKCSQSTSPVFNRMQLAEDGSQKAASQGFQICPCLAFDEGQSSKSPETWTCKLQSDTIQNLAKHIRTKYFSIESLNPEKGVTNVLQKLRTLSTALTAMVDRSLNDVASTQREEDIYHILHQMVSEFYGKYPISTFEVVESGIIKALVNYLSNGQHLREKADNDGHLSRIVEKRFEIFGLLLFSFADPALEEFPLLMLIRRLQSALSSVETFPVTSSCTFKMRNSYATVPHGRNTSYPCLKEKESSCSHSPSASSHSQGKSPKFMVSNKMVNEEKPDIPFSSPGETTSFDWTIDATDVTDVHREPVEREQHSSFEDDGSANTDQQGFCDDEDASPKLLFYLEGQQLDCELTLYQSILKQQNKTAHDIISSAMLWTRTYKIVYRRPVKSKLSSPEHSDNESQCFSFSRRALFYNRIPFFPGMFVSEVELERSNPTYDILYLLRSLEGINRFRFHLISRKRECAFGEGREDDLDKFNVAVYDVPQNEFVNSKLTEKLEQQMRDPSTVSAGAMPSWCTQLMACCPFLFGFEARFKYFHLAALGQSPVETHKLSRRNIGGSSSRQQNSGNFVRAKFLVHRNKILDSASRMMDLHANQKVVLEVEYNEEVGTGLGPTLEFYTLVCHEFQRSGLGMWRDDHVSHDCTKSLEAATSVSLASPFGLFPRPWLPSLSTSSGIEFSELIRKFVLLGQIVAKAVHEKRVLDLPLSKAFYKLILEKELTVYDILSFDPGFGKLDLCFRNTRVEDLYLDFTLPGYPDYALIAASDKMVNLFNLEEYVSLIVDATIKSGISRQMEAFKSGFDQVFPIRHLNVFTEEELEHLLCGEHISWNSDELLDNIKVDHGYTVSSPPVINLLEIVREFDHEQQRAFLQFVTGAPRLPSGGLASLKPKLTIVRKHCSTQTDANLPSVMTCVNYLKLPPYSSKEIMKEKLLYAITEGLGSFHLS
ncbi:E3 ubiquitin-protein ligase UPL4 [Abeliophyllum distichum]|uniref:HECT-type E3 ubiquitin transferase n=1 Tax=Abeliophyllum distichum TaxID=126358 RepID=A0ABD1QZ34_9LAMI